MTSRARAAVAAGATLLALAGSAGAATVSLRVEGRTATLFEGSVQTAPGPYDGGDGTGAHACNDQPSSAGALVGAALPWHGTWYPDFQDFFLDQVGPDASDPPNVSYWSILVNWRYAAGLCRTVVPAGGEVLLAYGPGNRILRLAGPDHVGVGQPFSVSVRDGAIRGRAGTDGGPVSGASVGGATTGADGSATLRYDTAGLRQLKATASDAIRSNALSVCVGDAQCQGAPVGDAPVVVPNGPGPSTTAPGAGLLTIGTPAAGTRYAPGGSTLLLRGSGPGTTVSLTLTGRLAKGASSTARATSAVAASPSGDAARRDSAASGGVGGAARRDSAASGGVGGAARAGSAATSSGCVTLRGGGVVAATDCSATAAAIPVTVSNGAWSTRLRQRLAPGSYRLVVTAGTARATRTFTVASVPASVRDAAARGTRWLQHAAKRGGSTTTAAWAVLALPRGAARTAALARVRAHAREAVAPATLALASVHATRDRTLLRSLRALLAARQRKDGSWGGEAFPTATAVRALTGDPRHRAAVRRARAWLRVHDGTVTGAAATLWAFGHAAPSGAVTTLFEAQGDDGGFAARDGATSDPVTTTRVLLGLAAADVDLASVRPDTAVSILDYLRAHQAPSGVIRATASATTTAQALTVINTADR
jgi:hypothetical protein